ncbi:MAG TPA: hypothetical protein VK559_05385 [Ferruginibacter sp.]|nr:hypothetical protein [Ferruginibacter sp.]
MKLTQLFFISVLLTTSFNAAAQDIIKMKDSSQIKAKIEKVTPTDITYRRATDPTGPEIIVYRQDVESITYQDGEKMMMDNGTYPIVARGHHHSLRWANPGYTYGRTILSFAFLQPTDASSSNGEGPGVYPGMGLQFEYMLTKKQNISLYIPVNLSLYSLYYQNNVYPYSNAHTHAFLYMYPGVKFYPKGSNRVFSYSIGPSVVLGFGRKYAIDNSSTYDSTSGTLTYESVKDKNVFTTGLMINNGINIMPTKHLYLGAELGLGFTVYSNDYNTNDGGGIEPEGSNNAGTPLIQFNMKVGYRF